MSRSDRGGGRAMIAASLLALPVATALLLAASARLPSLVSTLLVAYLALVGELAVVTWALSPLGAVTRAGLAVACSALLAAAIVLWWLRGLPGLPLAVARRAAAEVARDPVVLAFGAVVALVLGYELLLVLTAPPNNWDALTYHLPRVAAWMQEGGIEWIADSPRDNLNEYPPLAEQQILFLFVATGEGGLFAVPQFVAQLAILVAVYGTSRRLGFDVRGATCSACLLATFTLFALEATTAQNDLVAASFPAVAACLLLGRTRLELVAAGVALGFGLGAKLTTVLVWPVLTVLVLVRGRRGTLLVGAGGVAGFAAVGVWSYALNLAHTGRPLGQGGGRVEVTGSPGFPRSLNTGVHVFSRMLETSGMTNRVIWVLGLVGVAAAALAGAWVSRRGGLGRGLLVAAGVAVAFLSPALVLGAAVVIDAATQRVGLPLHPEGVADFTRRRANEDYSAFGALGAVVLVAVPILTIVSLRRQRRADLVQLALALAVPAFLVALALTASYNEFLTRFLILPVALTAPLFARLFRVGPVSAAIVAVAAVTVGVAHFHSWTKPVEGAYGRPWRLSQAAAVQQTWQPEAGVASAELERLVPATACVGAVLDAVEPSYLLWGPQLDRRIEFLPSTEAVTEAYRRDLFRVVVSTGANAPVAGDFAAAGWSVLPLGDYWLLAESPGAEGDGCGARG